MKVYYNATEKFQDLATEWAFDAFGSDVAQDCRNRSHRFLEESLELVQAVGCTKEEALQLVEYVFERPVGDKKQEIGGVMVTLATLCSTVDIDMNNAGFVELDRIREKIKQISEKESRKQKNSALPGDYGGSD